MEMWEQGKYCICICKRVWVLRKVAGDWKRAKIVPLYKGKVVER